MCIQLQNRTLLLLFCVFLQGYCDWKFPASWEKPSIINPDVVPTPHGSRCAGANQRATLYWNQVCTSTVVTTPLLPSPWGLSTGRLVWHSVSGNNKSWPSACKEPLLGKIANIWITKWTMSQWNTPDWSGWGEQFHKRNSTICFSLTTAPITMGKRTRSEVWYL